MKFKETSVEYVKCLPLRKRYCMFDFQVKQQSTSDVCNFDPSSSSTTTAVTTMAATLVSSPSCTFSTSITSITSTVSSSPSPTTSMEPKNVEKQEAEVQALIEEKSSVQEKLQEKLQEKPQEVVKEPMNKPTSTKRRLNGVHRRSSSSTAEATPSVKRKVKEEKVKEESDSDDDHEDDGKIYCVCRQPYNPNQWMIACDICNEWFHGKCVQITAAEAKKIKVYVCPVCREKNNSQIVYKQSKKKPSTKKKNGESNNTSPSSPESNNGSRSSSPTQSITAKSRNKKRKKVITDDVLSSQEVESNSSKRQRLEKKPSEAGSLENCTVKDENYSREDIFQSTSEAYHPTLQESASFLSDLSHNVSQAHNLVSAGGVYKK